MTTFQQPRIWLPPKGPAVLYKRILITGGAGFIGHHMVEHLLATTQWDVTVIDSLTYAGDPHRLTDIERYDPKRVNVVWHDLRAPLVGHPTERQIGDFDYVVHFASESHVDRSIADPVPFVRNNVDVTLTMLEWLRRHPAKFIQVSTDEVYGPASEGYYHHEWDHIMPSNPYSASKACQEALVFSWWRTYGVQVGIVNAMNNFGERQHPEKFIPMTIARILAGKKVTLHGSKAKGYWEGSSRVWLHARNLADAITHLLLTVDFPAYDPGVALSQYPARYNVVADDEHDVGFMAGLIADTLGRPLRTKWVDWHSSRPGHDARYALDGTKLALTGWKPPVPFTESLRRTVGWYVDHPEWLVS